MVDGLGVSGAGVPLSYRRSALGARRVAPRPLHCGNTALDTVLCAAPCPRPLSPTHQPPFRLLPTPPPPPPPRAHTHLEDAQVLCDGDDAVVPEPAGEHVPRAGAVAVTAAAHFWLSLLARCGWWGGGGGKGGVVVGGVRRGDRARLPGRRGRRQPPSARPPRRAAGAGCCEALGGGGVRPPGRRPWGQRPRTWEDRELGGVHRDEKQVQRGPTSPKGQTRHFERRPPVPVCPTPPLRSHP